MQQLAPGTTAFLPGSYALAFLAVLTGPELAPAAPAGFGIAALVSRWIGAFLLDRLPPPTVGCCSDAGRPSWPTSYLAVPLVLSYS